MTAIEIIRANPGLTACELAAKYGKHPTTYRNTARYHGVQLPVISKEEQYRRAAAAMRAKGERSADYVREHCEEMTTKEIADALGITQAAVYTIMRRRGITRSPERQAEMKRVKKERWARIQRQRVAYHHDRQLRGLEAPSKHYNVYADTRRNKVRSYLVNTYGYIYIEGDVFNLGYDSTTDRCTQWSIGRRVRKPEEYYEKKYLIKFYNLDDE